MPEAGLLAELPEAQAAGEARRIYAEIRRLCAVPMVALIYRHLATIPGALEWAWAALGPALRSGRLQRQAWRLAADVATPPCAISRAALRSVGLGAADEAAIAAVLDAYNRANPVNILALRCLALQLGNEAAGAPATAADAPAWTPPPAPAPLPPMVEPQAMDADVRALVLLLTDRAEDAAAPSPLWPSLYRHLARWPALLGCASLVVTPAFAAVDAAAQRLREQVEAAALALARGLPAPPELPPPAGAARAQVLLAIERFTQRIPEMVVIGTLLRRALPAPAAAARGGA